MSSATDRSLGLGVDAGLAPEVARDLASRCADLGYRSLWTNDEPTAPGLETLAHFAAGAPQLDVGVGVLPLDQYPPVRIAAEVARLELDPTKLWVGIGSGRMRPQLSPMRDAVGELRDLIPGARIMIGTMSPNMCRLAGEVADGVLLNWMLPAHAASAQGWVVEAAVAAGRDAPLAALYIRVAAGDDASMRLREEEGRYRRMASAHFDAMNVPLGSVGVAGTGRPEVVAELASYRTAVDLPIVRVLADRDLASLLNVAEAAAP